MALKSTAYIDGYNLYYGALRGHPAAKWLDLEKMCAAIMPDFQITEIKYFTARIRAHPNDPSQPQRQQAYLRALRTLKTVNIIEGWFIVEARPMTLEAEYKKLKPGDIAPKVMVVRPEEKGSDVNLGSHLVFDGCKQKYEVPAVLTCDSDLREPMRLVRKELGYKIALITPQKYHSGKLLKQSHAKYRYRVCDIDLLACQLPANLSDAAGPIHRPASWE